MEYDTLTFYQSGLFTKRWRWRFQAAGNGAKLATGAEGYDDQDWALKSAFRVCGLGNPFEHFGDVHVDTLIKRVDGAEVMVRFR